MLDEGTIYIDLIAMTHLFTGQAHTVLFLLLALHSSIRPVLRHFIWFAYLRKANSQFHLLTPIVGPLYIRWLSRKGSPANYVDVYG